jgi:ribonuclease BN (tRNA processing enzyme)
MRLRVLGCHGGESPSHRPSSFLVDDALLLDAGSVTRSLSLADQRRVDTVYLSHAHLDHTKDLPLLLDNVLGHREGPVEVVASDATARALEQHLFSGALWPDFTRIPSAEAPAVRIRRIPPGELTKVGRHELFTVPMTHAVECHGVIVTDAGGSVAYTGDTGPTDAFWERLKGWPRLRAILVEVSYPNELDELAHLAGHLTPRLLAAELDKLGPCSVPIYVGHVKPGHEDVVRAQIAELGDPRLQLLKLMDELTL